MGAAFGAASKVVGLGTVFFAVGAATGGAGWAATTSYFGTMGTGVVNTAYGIGEAASWAAELAA